MLPEPSMPPAGGGDDIVTVSFQIPKSQLDLATQIVGELAATLQAASDQAGGGLPGDQGAAPDNSPEGLAAALQGRMGGGPALDQGVPTF